MAQKSIRTASILVCRGVPKPYDYLLPEDGDFHIGTHVSCPFGKSEAMGIILDIQTPKTAPNDKLKPCGEVLEKKPVLSQELIDFIFWFADMYHCSPHQAYQQVIGTMKLRELPEQEESADLSPPSYDLTKEQEKALKTLRDNKYPEYLIQGVTASGKTEIYLQRAADIIKEGRSVIMLLPEIALTPQTQTHFKERFGDSVAVIHSGLTPKWREVEWNRLQQGQAKICIGPRSAIFSPLENIGLIIIDEEHEGTYKQESSPRYYTHDVARYRAGVHNATLILGSATPRLETLQRTKDPKNKSHLIVLKERIHKRPMPQIDLIDLTRYPLQGASLANPIIEAIQDRLSKKEKVIIFINRRGYAPAISCQFCAEVLTCKHCELPLPYHKNKKLTCHRCNVQYPMVHDCPSCKKSGLTLSGTASQKVEVDCRKLFPDANVFRLDSDTSQGRDAVQTTLAEFKESGDILIGTQMIAKGHHIESVSLVAVLGIDQLLAMPDFRAAERSFQLLTQVAGRTGRGEDEGHVMVQTALPQHYVIQYAQQYNQDKFYETELGYRSQFQYPPFGRLIHIILSSKIPTQLPQVALQLKQYFQDALPKSTQMLGPQPAPVEKIRDYHRWRFLFKVPHDDWDAVKELCRNIPTVPRSCRCIIDFDPQQLL